MIALTGHSGLVVALAYSPDGRTLASASADGTARLWDLATGTLTATLQSPAARAHCVAFSPDGKGLAVGYGEPNGLVQLWDVASQERGERWAAHSRITRGVDYHPDGDVLVTAGDGSGLQLWALVGRPFGVEPIGAVLQDVTAASAVTFSPKGDFLAAVTSRPGTVRLVQWSDLKPYRSSKQISDWGYSLAFNPTGDLLAVGLERTVALWNPADYRQPTIWPAHAGAVFGVAFTPDGRTLLTGGADGLVKLWDADTARLRHTFDWKINDVGAVAFAPDGLTAAAGGVGTILVWDVAE